jgi:MFS family permease
MLAALAPIDILAMAGFAMAGLGVANLVPVMFSAAGNHPGLPPGQAISTVTMVGYAGILVAPASIGYVAEHVGFRVTYGALAVLLVAVAMLAQRAQAADGIGRRAH